MSDGREMAEIKAKLKKANTTIAKQKAYIQQLKAGLVEVRARLLKAIRNLEAAMTNVSIGVRLRRGDATRPFIIRSA